VDDHGCNHIDAGAGEEDHGVVVAGCVKYTADDRGRRFNAGTAEFCLTIIGLASVIVTTE
jgi:hypothetical protein